MAHIEFDANEYEPMGNFDPLPKGEYMVVISGSEIKDNSKGTGKYLLLVYDVVDGEYHGRKLFDRLNIINDSAQAQQIGKGQLSAICRAVNVHHLNDTCELHDKPFIVKVGINPATEKFEASNSIKGYKTKDGESVSKKTETKSSPSQSSPAATTTTSESASKKKFWEKNK